MNFAASLRISSFLLLALPLLAGLLLRPARA
jgi:hypothetical protein